MILVNLDTLMTLHRKYCASVFQCKNIIMSYIVVLFTNKILALISLSGWFGIAQKVCGYVGRRGGGETMGYIIHLTNYTQRGHISFWLIKIMTIQMVWQSKIDKDVSSKHDIALPIVTWISFLFVPFSEFRSRFTQLSKYEFLPI